MGHLYGPDRKGPRTLASDNRMVGRKARQGVVPQELMNEKGRNDSEDLHAHRNDPDEWADEPVQIEVRNARSSVVSFRLPAEELEALSDAARTAGETLSEYIRTAIQFRVQGIAPGVMTMVFSGTLITSNVGAWSEAGQSETTYNKLVEAR